MKDCFFVSEEQRDIEVVNHIDYIIGLIHKQSGQQFQHLVVDALISSESMVEIRSKLIKVVAENQLLTKKEPTKKGQEKNDNVPDKKEKQGAINFLKTNANPVACLGNEHLTILNKKVNDCIYLQYEDYNKLVVFNKSTVSNFIEDLVQFITIGLISVQSVEMYLGHLRTANEEQDFTTFTTCATLQEFLMKKKYDQLCEPDKIKEPEVPINLLLKPSL